VIALGTTATLDPRVKYPALHDPAWLRRRYVDEGRTGKEITQLVGSSDVVVYRQLSRYGITRPRGWMPTREAQTLEPEREFVGLEERRGPLADLDADVRRTLEDLGRARPVGRGNAARAAVGPSGRSSRRAYSTPLRLHGGAHSSSPGLWAI
jgi:hypothetical protein